MTLPDSSDRDLRVGLVFQGAPTDERSWSGVPAGVASGLRDVGCSVAAIDARFPGAGKIGNALHMSWAEQAASRAFAAACGVAARQRLRRAQRLAGAIAIGSGYALKTDLPFVTYEDMTVAQALERSDPTYSSLSPAGAARWRARQQLIYERSRACCVASRWAAESIRRDYRVPSSKVHVVGFGRNLTVARTDRDWSTPRFLFVGADWKRKRGDAVLEAFAVVRQSYPNATLDLVGGHPPVAANGVTGHGPFPLDSADSRDSYCRLLRLATCLVMPSTYEPFGIAYLDAANAGVPSIGTTVGGAADAIGDGGLVIDPTDPHGLPEAMRALTDPETARRLGERAFKRSALFTWTAVAERLLRAIQPAGVDLEGLAPFLDSVLAAESF